MTDRKRYIQRMLQEFTHIDPWRKDPTPEAVETWLRRLGSIPEDDLSGLLDAWDNAFAEHGTRVQPQHVVAAWKDIKHKAEIAKQTKYHIDWAETAKSFASNKTFQALIAKEQALYRELFPHEFDKRDGFVAFSGEELNGIPLRLKLEDRGKHEKFSVLWYFDQWGESKDISCGHRETSIVCQLHDSKQSIVCIECAAKKAGVLA